MQSFVAKSSVESAARLRYVVLALFHNECFIAARRNINLTSVKLTNQMQQVMDASATSSAIEFSSLKNITTTFLDSFHTMVSYSPPQLLLPASWCFVILDIFYGGMDIYFCWCDADWPKSSSIHGPPSEPFTVNGIHYERIVQKHCVRTFASKMNTAIAD